jgi:CRISPR system Cascade subunit CasA
MAPGEVFQPLAFAFELFGAGPRFLQDLTLEADTPSEERIERLLIEAPGENTLRQGKDHFVKGGQIEALCSACAATALLALQINAPSGGQGHRTGLRGGGPLTTLIVHPESLWQTLWLNVLLAGDLAGEPRGKDRPEDRFPWLAPTRTSGKEGRGTTLADVHPLQMYWAMPRRIRLRPEYSMEPEGAVCSLCAGSGRPFVRTFLNRNLGVNYTGPWNHPLTPYRKAEEDYLPLHGSPAGLCYRDWLGLVQSDPDRQIRPAAVVEAFLGPDDSRRMRADYLLWAFGYDMDNMKARAWLDGRMPLLIVSLEHREAFELDARRLIASAAEAARSLVFAAKQALTDRPKDLARDPADVGVRFCQETEAPFYEHLQRIREFLEAKEDTVDPRRHWWGLLWKIANRAFESVTLVGSFEATEPKRVALAWNGLQRFFRSGKLQELLGLPVPPKKAERKTAGTPAETGDAR